MEIQSQEIEQLAAGMLNTGKQGDKTESTANKWFAPLKAMGVTNLDEANVVFSAAYEVNGWSQTKGRPAAGVTLKPAPRAVKLYTTTFRKGYKEGLDVLSFETVGELREATAKKLAAPSQTAARPPELKGIQVSTENRLTGALWHDAVVLHQHLTTDEQQEFEREIRMLMMRFTKNAPAELVQAAA